MGTYYTVSAQQAVVSGLTPFVAQSGLKSYGLGTGFKYKLTPQLNALGFVEYQRISGSAADSPLVAVRGTPDQFSFGLGLSYDFRLD